jgi:hypothetical protein
MINLETVALAVSITGALYAAYRIIKIPLIKKKQDKNLKIKREVAADAVEKLSEYKKAIECHLIDIDLTDKSPEEIEILKMALIISATFDGKTGGKVMGTLEYFLTQLGLTVPKEMKKGYYEALDLLPKVVKENIDRRNYQD